MAFRDGRKQRNAGRKSYVSEQQKALDALYSIPADCDYETWKDVGIAFKAAGGSIGDWLAWSATAPEKYHESTARKLFDNVSEDGAIGPGTLYHHARRYGWTGGTVDDSAPKAPRAAEKPESDVSKLAPVEQTIAQIEALFEPGENVNISVRAKWDRKQGKWVPADCGTTLERDELLERLKKPGAGGFFDKLEPRAGAWVCENPTDGGGRGKDHVAKYRHALVESDTLPVDEQVRIMRELDLPIASLTTSGGKSVHALVRVDAEGPKHYAERVRMLHKVCDEAGLEVDSANKDPSRLSRLAGVRRGEQLQTLVAVNIGARDFSSWEAARATGAPKDASRTVGTRREDAPPIVEQMGIPQEGGSQPKHIRLVDAILEQGFVFVDDTPCIPRDGVFEFGWSAVEGAILDLDRTCQQRTRKEAIATLALVAKHAEPADPRYIAFSNGVLDVKTMDFVTAADFRGMDVGIVPVTIPHDYSKYAERNEAVETLLEGVSCHDPLVRMNLEEFVGLSLSRYADNRNAAIWGYGVGENGKSTLWEAVGFIVGERNTCSLELSDYSEKFSMQMLLGKLLAVSDDQPADSVGKAVLGKVKKIVTGQPVKIEPKGVDPFNARLFCTIFATSNEPPSFSDTTHGSMRRWHIIPLLADFSEDSSGRDVELRDKLRTEEAAQWLIKLGIEGLKRVLVNEGMTETEYSKAAKQEAKERSNNVYEFLSDHPEREFLERPNVEVWYWRYCKEVKDKGGNPFTQSRFTQMVNTAYGFKTEKNGRYKQGDPEISALGIAREHERGVGDPYRVFVKKHDRGA